MLAILSPVHSVVQRVVAPPTVYLTTSPTRVMPALLVPTHSLVPTAALTPGSLPT